MEIVSSGNDVWDELFLAILVDPFTREDDSWVTEPPEAGDDGDMPEGGVFDVHSGSDIIGLNGIPYEEW